MDLKEWIETYSQKVFAILVVIQVLFLLGLLGADISLSKGSGKSRFGQKWCRGGSFGRLLQMEPAHILSSLRVLLRFSCGIHLKTKQDLSR